MTLCCDRYHAGGGSLVFWEDVLGPEKKGATERMTSVANRDWTSENSGAVNLTREADRLVSSRDERIDWQKTPTTRRAGCVFGAPLWRAAIFRGGR